MALRDLSRLAGNGYDKKNGVHNGTHSEHEGKLQQPQTNRVWQMQGPIDFNHLKRKRTWKVSREKPLWYIGEANQS